jgi:hypothetical protein
MGCRRMATAAVLVLLAHAGYTSAMDELLSAAQAAAVLGMSPRTLQDRARRAGWPMVFGRYLAALSAWRTLADPPPKTRGRPRRAQSCFEGGGPGGWTTACPRSTIALRTWEDRPEEVL